MKQANSALRAALMRKHGITEKFDKASGRMVFHCRGDYTQDVLDEIRSLEN